MLILESKSSSAKHWGIIFQFIIMLVLYKDLK